MLFIGLTSAYMFRRVASDWRTLSPPGILWLNTALLLGSSIALEQARRRLRSWDVTAARAWVGATGLLGALFVAGQYAAWLALRARGVYLASHPHSSFFYVLTAVHGVHLFAGVVALFYVLGLAVRYRLTPGESSSPSIAASYWHFVDGLWLYLMVVLFYL
jgi:cytochrome c oxidase subunit 3